MRTIIFVAAIAAAAVVPLTGFPRQTNTAARLETEEQRVLSAEDEYVAAEVNRDEVALRRLVDDRFIQNSSRGTTAGKEDLIQAILKLRMVGQTLRERSVLIEGDIALIFGTADLRLADPGKEERLSSLRYTSTYVKRQGQWRMLALQMQPRAKE